MIDPEATNQRAIHVYQKVGFKIIGEFIASWHPVPHYQMELHMKDLLETIEIRLAITDEQMRFCYKIMHQLRPHLTSEQALVEQVQRQIQAGYRLAYIQDSGEIKSLAGFRFLEFLAWGKVLYIDDLISYASTRRNGYGSILLKWVIGEAKKAKCDQVHLDSGPQRHDAHRLYLNYGFKTIGHHFSLDLKENV